MADLASFPILLVEDDPNHVALFEREFQQSYATQGCSLHSVVNGEDAVAYLSGAGRFADRARHPVPSLVLLDIALPGHSGFDVLMWIRKHPEFRTLPVVVQTASNHPEPRIHAHELGASWYFLKARNLAGLRDRMTEIGRLRTDIESRRPPASSAGGGVRRRVLVVEDDTDLRGILADRLRESGFQVEEASDGREAMERLLADPGVDVILLDLFLPGMDGWEFRRRQLSLPQLQRIPVVATTGYPERLKSEPLDGAAVLVKPFDLETLASTLRHCCA